MKLVTSSLFFAFALSISYNIQASIITQTEISDLELVSRNNGEEGGILPMIDHTVSKVGYQALKILLVNPITDIETLQARQNLILALQDKERSKKIQEQLLIIKQHEGALKRCFEPAGREQLATVLKKSYYRWGMLQGFNESQIALDVLHLFEFASLFGPLLEHLILSYALGALNDDSGHCHGHHHGHDHDNHVCLQTFLQKIFKSIFPSEAARANVIMAAEGVHLAVHLYNIKEMVEHLVYKADILNLVHQELISVHACIKASATIGDILADLPVDKAGINAEILTGLCDLQPTLVMQSLDPHFATTQNNRLNLLSPVGKTLATYQAINKQMDLINTIMSAAGAIDAMLSMSKLLEHRSDQYSLVTYKPGGNAYIELEDFVHPQLIGPAAAKNSIVLDQETGTHRLIITGPNKAGKSTITKAIAVNLVLAQTFGLAAAKKAVITVVHRIITYINILDNLSAASSSFLSEIVRADQAIQELTALDSSAPTFALFDDSLFRSTQAAEGEMAAYKFVKKIIELLHCTTLVVTHFEKLTQLETQTDGRVLNFKVDLIPGINGKTLSTYHLVPGISPRGEIFSLVSVDAYQSDLLAT